MELFWGLSEDEWEGLFSIANILIPGVILALFAIYYQQKKSQEIKLEGLVAMTRIQSYERLVGCFSELMITKDPSLADEEIINGIIPHVEFINQNIDIPACTASEVAFDEFYKKITELKQNEDVYLDATTNHELESSVALFTHCKMFLDAYCDTERAISEGKPRAETQKKIDFAYWMTAIVMKSQYNRTFLKLEDIIGKQLRHLRLGYRHYVIIDVVEKAKEQLWRFLDSHLRSTWVQNDLLYLMNNDYKTITALIPHLIDVYAYIHVMDRYTPDGYFEMDEEKRLQLTGDFMARLVSNVHW